MKAFSLQLEHTLFYYESLHFPRALAAAAVCDAVWVMKEVGGKNKKKLI